jgi:hypothetical protein
MLRKTILAGVTALTLGIGASAMFSQAQALPLGPVLAPLAENTSGPVPVYYYHGRHYRYRYHGHYYNHRRYRYY